MQKLGLSFLSLIVAAAAACGGTSPAADAQPGSSQTGDDGGPGNVPGFDGSTPLDGATQDAGSDSSTTIPNTPASGTVHGHTFTFAHGIAYPRSISAGVQGYEIFLSDKPLACGGATLEGSTTIDIDVAGQPPLAKTYPVVDAFKTSAGPNGASADFNALDATCGNLLSDSSSSGMLVLTKFDATTVSGAFDITFSANTQMTEGNVKGTFEAVVCPTFPPITCTPH
jgi:hypothetical protein